MAALGDDGIMEAGEDDVVAALAASTDSEVQVVNVVETADRAFHHDQWFAATRTRIVDVPGNGNCLYGA